MDFSLTPKQMTLEKECADFAKLEIEPNVSRLEEDLVFRRELFHKLAERGWFKLYQGDPIAYVLALKAIARVDAGIAVAMAVTNMVGEIISHFGTAEQQAHYLSKTPFSFAITEKNAGSDVKNIQMTAEQDPNGDFILQGEKQFITNADIAGAIIVIAKLKIENSHEITAFVVEQNTPGFQITKKERKLGLLTANLVGFKLDNCHIPKNAMLGKPGQGLHIALTALDSGRIGIAAQALGIAEGAYEAALQFSQEREQFGQPIGKNQVIAFKLVDMKVKLSASFLMLMKACCLKSQALPYTLEASEAKLYCSEACNEIAAEALQIHGGYGYIKDYPVEKYFRDARVTTIYEGTSEIQRLIISRSIGLLRN